MNHTSRGLGGLHRATLDSAAVWNVVLNCAFDGADWAIAWNSPERRHPRVPSIPDKKAKAAR